MALQHLADAGAALAWLRSRGVRTLATDSRRVGPGAAFIAWPGQASDGRRFAGAALDAGAVACVVEAEGVESFGFDDAHYRHRVIAVPGLKAATGLLADAWYGEPSRALEVLAVTGTNGKTSCAWWLAQALARLGRPAGVVGTLGIGVPPAARDDGAATLVDTGLTTPDPVTLHAALRGFADQGLRAVAIEASSIGIVEQRLAGLRLAVALFTNFTQDHLDYHGSMAAYWEAKRGLFQWPGLRAAVVNLDDPKGAELARDAARRGLDTWTVGVARAEAAQASPAARPRLRAEAVAYQDGGLAFTLVEGEARAAVRTALIGDYNVGNLLVVAAGLRSLGATLAEAATALAALSPVPGRLQRVRPTPSSAVTPAGEAASARPASGPEAVVDYAHTPDALEKSLAALRAFATERGGALVCVFGCGGNRDGGKRPLMGGIAQRGADRVIVTSDNPRFEAPGAILQAIGAGLQPTPPGGVPVRFIEDRREAIATALREAGPNDVVLIAGKGHEAYQEVAGVKHPFSDVEVARGVLAAREAHAS